MELLTTAEAAAYLRLKERKLYELVATAAIPCTKATGRWLFPKAELDRWLASGMVRPEGVPAAEPMPIVGGSHDPLLEWALLESNSGLAMLPEGSGSGLARFAKGEIVAAAVHLHALSEDVADANVQAMRDRPEFHDAVLIAFARREQGLVVAAGNPLGIQSLHDVAARRARLAVRPLGAGAQLLLEALVQRGGIRPDDLARLEPPCPTGPDIAQAIRAAHADCGIATRAVANAAGLDFVPLLWERFDLVMRQRHYFRAPLQKLVRFLNGPALARRAAEMGGYDVAGAGEVRFAR
jgi:putative molybdopterin biosynthesis protein